MPRIDDQQSVTKRSFQKKAYRPWALDLLDEIQEPSTQKKQPESTLSTLPKNKESNSNHLVINEKPDSNHKETYPQEIVTNLESISSQKSNRYSNHSAPTPASREQTNTMNATQQIALRDAVQRVYGIQRKILFYIVHECVSSNQLKSGPITMESLKIHANTDIDTAKTALQRLINKCLIQREKGKRGRGGFAIFHITEELKIAVMEEQRLVNFHSQLVIKKDSIKEPMPSSSSINVYNKTTTELSEEWLFDITPYRAFGFTHTQLKQLAQLPSILASSVEQSLIEFRYDNENNFLPKNIKTGKLNYLMGILRNGGSYTSTAYVDEQQKILNEMARRVEDRQKKLIEDKFLVWHDKLSDNDKEGIYKKMPMHLQISEKASGINSFEVKAWYMDFFLQTLSKPE